MTIRAVVRSLGSQPGYTLMRAVARFNGVRRLIAGTRSALHARDTARFLDQTAVRFHESPFAGLDCEAFARRLRDDGVSHGLTLPLSMVQEISHWADTNPCYADRLEHCGFRLRDHAQAQQRLGKPILLAQYFNTCRDCSSIDALARDPVLLWIACRYLGSIPTFLGANLWWTFPVDALESDRMRHAHLFHRDVDDFRFFKYFFYLTDVPAGEGAHVCVLASHDHPPRLQRGDAWKIRRYRDDEIAATYDAASIQEVCGPAGTGFAENTLCIHKGSTPRKQARLLLQLQFGLFDYGAMHDRRASEALAAIV